MPGNGAMDGLERFEYPDRADAPFVPSWNGWEEAPDAATGSAAKPANREGSAGDRAHAADFERRLGEETRRSFEVGRARGLEEGRGAERQAQAAAGATAEETRIRAAAALAEQFARQRDRYFQAVEQEVVKLALAVAARILRREAQTDPLLLMGAVRVALGQLAASTEVRLRVPPADLDLWTEAMALLPNMGSKPLVVPGDAMRVGECVLETRMGAADLGIPGQLAEVERSFFGRRPEPGPAAQNAPSEELAVEVSG